MMMTMMMMIITHYDDDDDDDAPNAVSWNYAMRPTKTTNLWSVHQTKQWDLLSTSESPRFCKWIYSPYYFCTALPPPILSRAVRLFPFKGWVRFFNVWMAVVQCEKMWYNNWYSYYVCWFGWKFHDVALHLWMCIFNALMATDQDQHENICAQIVMRNVSWCCISRVLTAVMVYIKNGLFY